MSPKLVSLISVHSSLPSKMRLQLNTLVVLVMVYDNHHLTEYNIPCKSKFKTNVTHSSIRYNG